MLITVIFTNPYCRLHLIRVLRISMQHVTTNVILHTIYNPPKNAPKTDGVHQLMFDAAVRIIY